MRRLCIYASGRMVRLALSRLQKDEALLYGLFCHPKPLHPEDDAQEEIVKVHMLTTVGPCTQRIRRYSIFPVSTLR